MTEDADAVECFEFELDGIINRGHRSGLNYWQILRMFLSHCVSLQMQADVEYYLKLSRCPPEAP